MTSGRMQPRMVSLPVLAAIHTAMQVAGTLLIFALSFALSSHDARKLDVFAGLMPIVATIGFAKLAAGRVAPMSLAWPQVITLSAIASGVCFALTFHLGPIVAHHRADRSWWIIALALAGFQAVVALRMLIAARDGRA